MISPDVEREQARIARDPHRSGLKLSDVILGGQDGVVNTLGLLLGVAQASHDRRMILAAGLAAALAESVSMAAVAFTSARAETALYQSELERERRHIQVAPVLEREDVRDIFRNKGLSGDALEQVVTAVTSNPDAWVGLMMAEEHHLAPKEPGAPLRGAAVVGVSALVGALIPVAPFVVLTLTPAMWASVLISGLALFGVGAYQARVTTGRWWARGVELAAIGTLSALAGYLVGRCFEAPIG